MNCTILSATFDHHRAHLLQVEGQFLRGFTGIQLIGNPSEVCREAKERAKAALEAEGIYLPNNRLVISLSPANLKKEGSHFDLAVGLCMAHCTLQKPASIDLGRYLFLAELKLNGDLKSVPNLVAFALEAAAKGLRGIVVAADSVAELKVLIKLGAPGLDKLEIVGFQNFRQVLNWIYSGERAVPLISEVQTDIAKPDQSLDYMHLNDDQSLAALVTASGCHSLLLRGSPGTGKTMLAKSLVSLFPRMPTNQHLESLRVHSIRSERLDPNLLAGYVPFRHPHHNTSTAALLGATNHPGELALAHGGILFLDELPEFRRDNIEALREPLESGEIRFARAQSKLVWQARLTLIAACNNCPCGWFGSKRKICKCGKNKMDAYRNKLSGPILDRIDIQLNMPELSKEETAKIFLTKNIDRTQSMQKRVINARQRAASRNQKLGFTFNSEIPANQIVAVSAHTETSFNSLVKSTIKNPNSARSVLRSLRVARTLADLDDSEKITTGHLTKAWSWQAEEAAKQRGEHLSGL